jgi:hypothetical protein
MTLRELRVWHWQLVLTERAAAEDKRASRHTAKRHHARANFHLGAVQALNDVPELRATTAEQDAEALEQERRRRPSW